MRAGVCVCGGGGGGRVGDACMCALTDYTRNCNIFHAWYQNTFVLYIPHAWRGIFQRDNFFRSCEVSFCSGCDRRNSIEREMIIGI